VIDFTVEVEIERPVAEVFDHVSDPAKLETWQTNTVSARQEDTGPVGVGTRLREVHRAPGGKELESLVEVSEYEPERTFGLRVVEGTPIDARLTFEPTEAGTLMRFRSFGRLTGPMRLVQPLLKPALKRQFTQHCDTLKHVLEEAAS
jgi:uncharacterized protein YndB with AHSA1/START domain